MFQKTYIWFAGKAFTFLQVYVSSPNFASNKPFVPDNFKKYKIKRIPRINILVVLKYKTNKELFKISRIFR